MPLIIFSFCKLQRLRRRYIKGIVQSWAESLIRLAGGRITVKGVEKIPLKSRLCFIANHQGAFDIPIILANLPEPVGFIAKKELVKIPILNLWMNAIGCIFIDRSDKRGAVEVIRRGVKKIRNGQAMDHLSRRYTQ